MTLGGERVAVQDPLIRYAREAGWEYLPPDEARRLRRGEAGLLLHEVFVEQLQRLNPSVVDHLRAEEVAKRLLRVPPTIEGNLEAWEYLKGLKSVFVEDERRERDVRLLDLENVGRNTFHVTDELSYTNGIHRIRADVVFLINGVPVVFVEAKAATRVEGIAEALDQVRRYHREGPELMALLQLYSLTHLVRFYYGATWSLSRKGLYDWRDEQETWDFEALVKAFFEPVRILKTLSDYILFTRKDEELSKVVLRPHQMRAVERVRGRARDPVKRRGLVWHTQGSGKTYTMITVAKKLIEEPEFENPTVLMIVDRNELESQLFGNLEAVGFGNVEVAQTRRHLLRLLREDRRGLIVSTIHKFDDVPANTNTRENVFVLVDEAHRTTGGELGNYLMGALPKATYVGFTGTPIDGAAHGRGTFKTFGADDEEGYLDKYSIRESIEDGATVPLHYALAPNDLLVDRDTLEKEFLEVAELEGVSDVNELNRVLDRSVNLKNMLKNRTRVSLVAEYVARHFEETIEPAGYKAFLVGVDREACALYKKVLDLHLPPEYSEVVISGAHNDSPELVEFHLREDEEQQIRKSFRKPGELPKILIVTEKLLTGFDAPILYCMYLDKPMRDHVLLQAIARVNRPYEDAEGRGKPAGFVLDFVGIFDKLEKALAFDSEEVRGVVEGIEVLRHRFETLVYRGREEYLYLTDGLVGDKAAEAVLLHFRDKETRQGFYRYFRELEELYEILSPDPFLRPFLKDFEGFAGTYRLLRSAYEPNVPVDKSLMRKTARLVEESTGTTLVREPKAEYDLNPMALERLVSADQPEAVKVFNLLKAIRGIVDEEAGNAYLTPIGERAEAIAVSFEERQSTAGEALQDLEKLAEDLRRAEERRKESDLSEEAFAVSLYLENEGVDGAEKIAANVSTTLEDHPHWRESATQEREVRITLLKALREASAEKADAKKLVGLTEGLMAMLRRASS